MDGMEVLKVTLFLIGFCSLLFLTYVTTRYIGGKQSKAMKGKNISIVETVALGMDKRLHLIKAGKQYVLVASTSKSVEFLTTVDMDEAETGQEIKTQTFINGSLFDFKTLFEKYLNNKNKRENSPPDPESEVARNVDFSRDFSSNLSRLRNILQSNTYQAKENGVDITNEK